MSLCWLWVLWGLTVEFLGYVWVRLFLSVLLSAPELFGLGSVFWIVLVLGGVFIL